MKKYIVIMDFEEVKMFDSKQDAERLINEMEQELDANGLTGQFSIEERANYMVFIESGIDIFTDCYDSAEEAIEAAKNEWLCLSANQKKDTVVQAIYIEEVQLDDMSGDIIWNSEKEGK